MKKYAIYFLWLPMLVASCTDVNELPTPAADAYHRVTASISSVSASSRVAIDGQKTAFTDKDPIGIGWQYGGNSYQYQYAYSAAKEMFAAAESDNNKDLWSNLIKAGSNQVDIYAWYGKLPASADGTSTMALPADDSSISVEGDQSVEENYLSSLYMAAHIKAAGTANNLDFEFKHLVSRIRLTVNFTDGGLKAEDIEGAVVKMSSLKVGATVGKGTNSDYQLTATDGTSDITMYTVRTDAAEGGLPGLEANCLVPSQTLTTANKITITLKNGKQYTCSLSKGLALDAGRMVTLVATVNAVEVDMNVLTITVIPNTEVCSFWGNLLITSNSDKSVSVYEKLSDGTWGAPSYVYTSTDFNTQLKLPKAITTSIDICGTYAGLSRSDVEDGDSGNDDILYLFRKDAETGNWYVSETRDNTPAYGLVMNEHFIAYGPGAGNASVVPIEDGKLGTAITTNVASYKLSIADNDILCGKQEVGKLTKDEKGGVTYTQIKSFAVQGVTYMRCFTDGIRVIQQYDGSSGFSIYKIKEDNSGVEEETVINAIQTGSGRPVVVSGIYALAGKETAKSGTNKSPALVMYYFDGSVWQRLGKSDDTQSFLHILQRYAPINEIKDLQSFEGNRLTMKGTNVSIVNNKITYFIENIDKIVEQYLADTNKPEGWWDPNTVLPAAF